MKKRVLTGIVLVLGLALGVAYVTATASGESCKMTVAISGCPSNDLCCPPEPLEPEPCSEEVTVNIRNGPSGLKDGETFSVTEGSTFQWSVTVNGFTSGWKTSTGQCDATLTVAPKEHLCCMHIELPPELVAAGATVNIRNLGTFKHCDCVCLPMGINIQWSLMVNGFTSGWKTKPVDCTDLVVEAGDWCETTIVIPDGCPPNAACGDCADCTVPITLNIRNLGNGHKNGQCVILPQSIDIQYSVTVNGFTSSWKTKHIDCSALVVTDEDLCCMHIELPPELVAAGATVNIRDLGTFKHCDCICLPMGINIQWSLTVNGFTSGWKTKPVDCTDLVVEDDDWCETTIVIPDGCPPNAACSDCVDCTVPITVNIRNLGNGYTNGQSVILPQSINIQYSVTVNGFTSSWKTKHVDCNALVVSDEDLCCMHIELPPELVAAGATVNIRNLGTFKHCDCICLPMGINIEWSLTVNGFTSGWKTKPVDCTDLVVEDDDWCLMEIQMREDLQRAGAQVAIRNSSLGWMGHGDKVYLPTSINIQWKLKANNMECGYYTKHVDCTPVEVAFKGTVKLPQELIDAGATVSIRYAVSGLGDGDTFDAVPGASFQWKLEVNGFESGYKTTSVACDGVLEVTTADYCHMEIQIPDEGLRNAGAQVAIRYSSFGWMGHGTKVYLPQSINIQWKLKVNGFESGYKSKHVDCTPIVVQDADWCLMEIQIPDEGLRNAGAQVAIRYSSFGWMGHGTKVYLPQSISIQWKLKVNGFEGGYKSKHVDCTPIVVQDADWCLMEIQIPDEGLRNAGAQVAIRYSSFGWMGHGTKVYLPQSINIQWKLKVNGFEGGYKSKHVDCTPVEVQDADWCLMEIQMREDLQRAGAQVAIRYSSLGWMGHGTKVYLPTCINIEWKLKVSNLECGYSTKHVDCTPLEVAFKGTVKLPQELIDAGATVSIRYAVSGLGDGDTFDAVPGKNFQWKLEVNGFESGYKTTSVACDGILEVTTADYCEMEIQVPDVCPQCPEAEACANPEDCQVPIEVAIRYSKFGWLGNGAKVILPKGINIQWKLRVNGFQSGYQSKPVDCTALVVPEGDLCCMHIEMPQDLQEAGGQVAIRYSEFGWLDHCKCVCLPKGINIQWKLKVNGFESGYKSKPVDCTPIVVEDADWCLMKIQIPDGAQVAIRYSSFGWMGDGTEVYLPQGINIQWKIYIDGAWSGYNTKKIDCSPLVYP